MGDPRCGVCGEAASTVVSATPREGEVPRCPKHVGRQVYWVEVRLAPEPAHADAGRNLLRGAAIRHTASQIQSDQHLRAVVEGLESDEAVEAAARRIYGLACPQHRGFAAWVRTTGSAKETSRRQALVAIRAALNQAKEALG